MVPDPDPVPVLPPPHDAIFHGATGRHRISANASPATPPRLVTYACSVVIASNAEGSEVDGSASGPAIRSVVGDAQTTAHRAINQRPVLVTLNTKRACAPRAGAKPRDPQFMVVRRAAATSRTSMPFLLHVVVPRANFALPLSAGTNAVRVHETASDTGRISACYLVPRLKEVNGA